MLELIIFLFVLISILSSGNYLYLKILNILNINTNQNFYFKLSNIFGISLILNYFIIWVVGLISINKFLFILYYFVSLLLFAKPFYYFLIENIISQKKKFLKLSNDKKTLIIGILFYFLILLLNSGAPPVDFDSLHYHLLIPKKYIEQGIINIDASWGGFDFFPFLIEYFGIIFLLFNIESGVQFLNVFITLNIAFCIYTIGNLLKINTYQKLLSIIFFIFIKNIIWLSGTSHNELLLCFFYLLAFINLLKINENLNFFILFSISCVGMLYTKYLSLPLGITFIPFIIYFFYRNKNSFNLKKIFFFVSPLFLFLPFLLRNYLLTEDPLFPLFDLTNSKSLGYSNSLLAFLKSPLDIFFFGNKYFDGQQIGSPYLICFIPLFYLFKKEYKFSNFINSSIIIYYTLWFFFLGKQVRFLVPIFPFISLLASIGITNFINFLKKNYYKFFLIFIIFIFILNQSIFLIAYSSVRIPSFFSYEKKIEYLKYGNKNFSTNYAACNFLNKNLKKNQNYISLNFSSFFYCPINSSITGKYNNFLDNNLTFTKNKVDIFVKNNDVKYILLSKINSYVSTAGLVLGEKKLDYKQQQILDNYLINKMKIYEDKLSIIYIIGN